MTTGPDLAGGGVRLRHFPGYLRFWTASTLSDFGSAVTTLALQVLVLTSLGGTATDVGAVSSARWAAYLVLGLVAGMWIDRVRPLPVLVMTDLFRGLLLGAVCTLALTSSLTMPGLLVLIAAFGVLSLFHDSADLSFLPSLVPRPLLTRANARLELSTAVAQTSGPAVAGLLIRLVSAPVAILLDALSYLVGALVLLSIRSPEVRVVRAADPPTARAEIAEGLRWVYRHRLLGTLALNDHLWFFCWAVLNTVLVTYALTALGMGALALGITLALAGVGAVAGTSVSERAAQRWGAGRVMFVARLLYAPATALTALAPAVHGSEARWSALALFAAAQLVIGVAMGAEGPVEMGFRQALTPDRLQGRANTTIRSVNRTMIVIGAPVGGVLGDHLGLRPTLWIAAAGFALVALTFGFSRMRTAGLDEPDDEA